MTPLLLILLVALVVYVYILRRDHKTGLHDAQEQILSHQNGAKRLLQDQVQLNSILSNMVEGVLGVDRDGKIIAVNPALARIFGFSIDESKGKHYLEVLRHSQVDDVITTVIQRCAQEGICDGQFQELRTFSPGERVFEAHVEPMTSDGVCTGAIVVLHDITTMRRLEQVRRDFVANVSHELKTPLASIMGFSETLLAGALEDKQHRREFVESIEHQATRMNRLVGDLLDLSAIESGQRKPNKNSFSLRDLALDASTSLMPLARKKSISIRVDISPSLPDVTADKEQLKQVFLNLIGNAVKYTGDQGSIRIDAVADDAFVRVSVEDNGVGIPPADLPRVFERFYRIDKARSREQGGTGLGLSIVKHIIEAHNGSVGVTSTEGQGAVFFFTLPKS